MAFIKRIALWIVMNMAIIALFSIVTSIFGINGYITPYGLDLTSLLVFAAFFGFAGSFISLLLSKTMAKWSFKIKPIQTPQGPDETIIYSTVQKISQQLGIKMPEVGIYESPEVNAFATGASKNNALVAVSRGLLNNMTSDEIEGVVGHEMAHIANGDMVTKTLLQGVLNTFVIFLARIVAYAVARGDNDGRVGFEYYIVAFIAEIIFGLFASILLMYFSRVREFAADSGSAKFVGRQKMIAALQKLQAQKEMIAPGHKSFATMKISDRPSWLGLLSTHPPLQKRIEALQKASY